MFMNIGYWLILIAGLLLMTGSIMEYYKLIKNSKVKSINQDKVKALLNIVVSSFYFILGLLLLMELIPNQYAFTSFIVIFLLEKLVKYTTNYKYKDTKH